MKNDYRWKLDNDCIAHFNFNLRGAHYSKNWDKQKQDDYNRWYYQHNKDKWKNSIFTKNLQNASNDEQIAKRYSWIQNMNRNSANQNAATAINNLKQNRSFGNLKATAGALGRSALANGRYALARGNQALRSGAKNVAKAANQIAYDNTKYSNKNIAAYEYTKNVHEPMKKSTDYAVSTAKEGLKFWGNKAKEDAKAVGKAAKYVIDTPKRAYNAVKESVKNTVDQAKGTAKYYYDTGKSIVDKWVGIFNAASNPKKGQKKVDVKKEINSTLKGISDRNKTNKKDYKETTSRKKQSKKTTKKSSNKKSLSERLNDWGEQYLDNKAATGGKKPRTEKEKKNAKLGTPKAR